MTDEEKGAAVVTALRGIRAFRRTNIHDYTHHEYIWIYEGDRGGWWSPNGFYEEQAAFPLEEMLAGRIGRSNSVAGADVEAIPVPAWFTGNPR